MGHFFCAVAVNGNILGAASSTGIVYAVFCGTFYFQAVVYIIEVGGVAAFICFVGKAFAAGIAAFAGAFALYFNSRTAAAVIFIACAWRDITS